MVELTGYDHSNNKGFKKLFFEEKKSGGPTQAAQAADTLVQNDWVEVTMDDSSYHNVTMIKKIDAPAGAPAESQGAGSGGQRSSGSGGGGGSDKMSKAEWAAKDLRKDTAAARSVSLNAAVNLAGTGINKTNVAAIQKLAPIFELYLMHGDFNYVKPEPVVAEPEPVAQPDNSDVPDNVEDDEIPF